MAKPEDRGQGGAQFVADARQKVPFVMVEGFQLGHPEPGQLRLPDRPFDLKLGRREAGSPFGGIVVKFLIHAVESSIGLQRRLVVAEGLEDVGP